MNQDNEKQVELSTRNEPDANDLNINNLSLYWPSILISLIIGCVSAVGCVIYVLFSQFKTIGLGIIMLPFMAIVIFVVNIIFILLTLLIIRFIKLKYKFVWFVFIEIIIILIAWQLTHLSEIKTLSFVFALPGYVIVIYAYTKYKSIVTPTDKLTLSCAISLICSTIIICLVYFGGTIFAKHDIKPHAKIDLQNIVNPAEIPGGYQIYYIQNATDDTYQKISIVDFNGKKESSAFFQGDIDVSLVPLGTSDDTNFNIGSLRVKETCNYFYKCDVIWQKGNYQFYMVAGMYGNTTNQEDIKKRLQDSINRVVSEIDRRSSYLSN